MAQGSGGWGYKEIKPGTRFRKWTVIREVKPEGKTNLYIECRCDCGTVKTILKSCLTAGRSGSCILCRRMKKRFPNQKNFNCNTNVWRVKEQEIIFSGMEEEEKDPVERYLKYLDREDGL